MSFSSYDVCSSCMKKGQINKNCESCLYDAIDSETIPICKLCVDKGHVYYYYTYADGYTRARFLDCHMCMSNSSKSKINLLSIDKIVVFIMILECILLYIFSKKDDRLWLI